MYKYILVLMIVVFCSSVSSYDETLTEEELDIRKTGDVLQIALPAFGFAMTFFHDGEWYGDQEGRRQFIKQGLGSVLTMTALKGIGGKLRPDGTLETNPDTQGTSFPSGHTMAAFWGASFIQRRYGWGWGTPAYALAAFTGYSRVQGNKHFVDDVVIGASIGVLYSIVFVDRWEPEGMSIEPTVVGPEAAPGIKLDYSW